MKSMINWYTKLFYLDQERSQKFAIYKDDFTYRGRYKKGTTLMFKERNNNMVEKIEFFFTISEEASVENKIEVLAQNLHNLFEF